MKNKFFNKIRDHASCIMHRASSIHHASCIMHRASILLLMLMTMSVGEVWGVTKTSVPDGVYACNIKPGANNRFAVLNSGALYLYRVDNSSFDNTNGMKLSSNHNAIVFYLSTSKTITTTCYLTGSGASDIPIEVKSINENDFNKFVTMETSYADDGSKREVTGVTSSPTSYNYSVTVKQSSGEVSSSVVLAAGYYYLVATENSGKSYLKSITFASAAPTKTVYLKPGSTFGSLGTEKFGVYDATNNKWVSGFMTKLDGCNDGYWSMDIPASCSSVIFGRYASDATQQGWNWDWQVGKLYNQSVTINLGESNCYTMTGWDNGNATGTPSSYTLKYSVTFNKNGKGSSDPASQCVASGGKASAPTNPTANGYVVDGWYENSACTGSAWDFNAGTITEDKELFAHWVEDLSTGWYLRGTFNNNGDGDTGWGEGGQKAFTKKTGESTGSVAYVDVTLTAGQVLKFKLYHGSSWYGSEQINESATMASAKNMWSDNSNNATITAAAAGTYTFKIDYSGTYPSIQVTYPAGCNNLSADGVDGVVTISGATTWDFANVKNAFSWNDAGVCPGKNQEFIFGNLKDSGTGAAVDPNKSLVVSGQDVAVGYFKGQYVWFNTSVNGYVQVTFTDNGTNGRGLDINGTKTATSTNTSTVVITDKIQVSAGKVTIAGCNNTSVNQYVRIKRIEFTVGAAGPYDGDLYVLGSGTPADWTTSNAIAFEKQGDGNYVINNIYLNYSSREGATLSDGFKLPTCKCYEPKWIAKGANKEITTKGDPIPLQYEESGSPDYKFFSHAPGHYKLVANFTSQTEGTIQALPVIPENLAVVGPITGSSEPWNVGQQSNMSDPVVDGNTKTFTWKKNLAVGNYAFCFCSQSSASDFYLHANQADLSATGCTLVDEDAGAAVDANKYHNFKLDVTTAGVYKITVTYNTTNNTVAVSAEPVTYTVNFGAADGCTAMGSVSAKVGDTYDGGTDVENNKVSEGVTVWFKAIPETGHHFVDWCDKNGSNEKGWSTYNPKNFGNVTYDINMYAKFAIDQYDLTFDSKGGSAVANQTIDYNGHPAAVDAPTKLGYTFDGWSETDGGDVVADITTLTITGAKTLYAKWSQMPYAETADFAAEAAKGGSATAIATFLNNKHYSITSGDVSWDNQNGKPADVGLKIKTNNLTLAFWVDANKEVTITTGTLAGANGGTASLSMDGGANYTITLNGAATKSTGEPVVNGPYKTTEPTLFVIKTNSSSWNILNKIEIADPVINYTYKVYGNFSGEYAEYVVTDGSATIEGLARNTPYDFKIKRVGTDGSEAWYGATDDNNIYTTSGDEWTLNGEFNVHMTTGARGNYVFHLAMDGENPQISVTYPTAYTITFDGNEETSGSMTDVTLIASGENVDLPANAFVKDGYHFSGWKDQDENVIADRAQVTVTKNLTLTAQWEKEVQSITIHAENDATSLQVGETLQMSITYEPEDATYGRDITWGTDNETYLSITGEGVVTAKRKGSGHKVTARSANGKEAEYRLEINGANCEDMWSVHMWNMGGTHTRACMTQYNGNEYRSDLVTLPSNSDAEKLKVLYNGLPQTGSAEWTTRYVPMYQKHSTVNQIYPGQDALGYFVIDTTDNTANANKNLRFEPIYVITHGVDGQAGWQIHDFAPTTTANRYETELVQVPEGYFTNDNYKYYVGTKRASTSEKSPFVETHDGKTTLSEVTKLKPMNGLKDADLGGTYGKYFIYNNSSDKNWYCQFDPYYVVELYDRSGSDGDRQFGETQSSPASTAGKIVFSVPDPRPGYTFAGWQREDGTFTVTEDKPEWTNYGMYKSYERFNAVWNKNPYTITLEAPDATTAGTVQVNVVYGSKNGIADTESEDPIKITIPEKTGYDFTGYYATGTADTLVIGSDGFFIKSNKNFTDDHYNWKRPSNVTLYAKWTPKNLTITFDANGGKIEGADTKDLIYIYDGAALEIPNVDERDGYTFHGWFTESVGGTPITEVGTTNKPTTNTTYFAHWTKDPVAPVVTWNVEETVYAGGKYAVSVTTTSDAELEVGNLMVSNGNGTLTNKAVDGQTITATLVVPADATEAPSLRLQTAATDEFLAGDNTKSDITLGECSGGGEEKIYEMHMTGTGKTNFVATGGTAALSNDLSSSSSDIITIGTKNYYKINGENHTIRFTPTGGIKTNDVIHFHICADQNNKNVGALIFDPSNTQIHSCTQNANNTAEADLTYTFEADMDYVYIKRASSNTRFYGVDIVRTNAGAGKQTANLAWNTPAPEATVNKTLGDEDFTYAASSDNCAGEVVYASSDENVATVSNGTVTILKAGTTTITATVAKDGFGCFNEKSLSYTLEVADNCVSAELAYTTTAINKIVGEAAFVNELTNPHSVAVTYTSTNTSAAKVTADGTVTIVGAGVTTIKAQAERQTIAGVTYCADEVTYEITVTVPTYNLTVVDTENSCALNQNNIEEGQHVTVTYNCALPASKHLTGYTAKKTSDESPIELTNYLFDEGPNTLTFDMPAYDVTLTTVWENDCTPIITWAIPVNTTAEPSATGSTTDETNITSVSGLNNAGGLTYTNNAKANLTGKIEVPSTKNNDKYLYFTFNVNSGKLFVADEIVVKMQPVNSTKSASMDVVISDNQGHSLSKTFADKESGKIHTLRWTLTESEKASLGALQGTCTLKLYCYGAAGTYRLGTPITICGAIAEDLTIATGETYTISTGTETYSKVTVKGGATLAVTNGATLNVGELYLTGGLLDGGGYDVPRVYVESGSTLTKENPIVFLDLSLNAENWYPLAVPFPVTINGGTGNTTNMENYKVRYAEDWLNQYAKYDIEGNGQVIIKTYDGAHRAATAVDHGNWKGIAYNETLTPGIGYIIKAVTVGGKAVIRFEMNSDAEVSHSVHVDAWGVDKGTALADNHKGWNMLGVPYMSCFGANGGFTSEDDAEISYGETLIQDGKIVIGNKEARYVTVPTYDFSEYIQTTFAEAKLKPEWGFFVQVGKSGTLIFENNAQSQAPWRISEEKSNEPEIETAIVLSRGAKSDKTGLILHNDYSADYEIDADLEKMFGDGYTLATYTIMNGTRLAYNAMDRATSTQIIPLGYRAPEEGEYTYSLDSRYNTEGIERIDLIDYETGALTNLLSSSYTFTTGRMQSDERFAINVTYSRKVGTGVDEYESENGKVEKVMINEVLYIIRDGRMYDAQGKIVK